MFNDSKYTNWYQSLVQANKPNIYTTLKYECHHIIPHSMGGSNEQDNLVYVTPRLHFILHRLLTKMCIDSDHKRKMCFAMQRLTNCKKYNAHFTNRTYEIIRLEHAAAMSQHRQGIIFSDEHRANISKVVNGRTLSASCRSKMSITRTGMPFPGNKESVANKVTQIWKDRKAGLLPLPISIIRANERKLQKQVQAKALKEQAKILKEQAYQAEQALKASTPRKIGWIKSEESRQRSSEATAKLWELRRAGELPMPSLSVESKLKRSTASSKMMQARWDKKKELALIIPKLDEDRETQ